MRGRQHGCAYGDGREMATYPIAARVVGVRQSIDLFSGTSGISSASDPKADLGTLLVALVTYLRFTIRDIDFRVRQHFWKSSCTVFAN